MVEIEEIKDDDDVVDKQQKKTSSTSTTTTTPPPGKKYRKPKKDLPSVGELLAHGAPETRGKQQSWFDILWFPIFVIGMFIISLQIFRHAPSGYRKPRVLPKIQTQQPPPQQQSTDYIPTEPIKVSMDNNDDDQEDETKIQGGEL